jgi:hypothetical protein
MGTVMVKCPKTGREIPTGLEVEAESFYSSPVFFARTYCPICRKDHEWFAGDAWVCESNAPMRANNSRVAARNPKSAGRL